MKEIQLWTVSGRKAYSEEELNFIKENYEKLGSKKISEILGRSQGGIQHFAKKIKISELQKQISLTDEELKIILKKIEEVGVTHTAEYYEINLSTLRKYLKKNGIEWKSLLSPFLGEEIEEVIRLHKAGKGVMETSRITKRNPQSIRNHLIKNGFEPKNRKYRPVVALNQDGSFYKKFPRCSIAADEVGVSHSSVVFAAQGKYKTAGGYKWLYEEDYKKMIAEQKAGEA